MGGLVEDQDTHHCVDDVSPGCLCQFAERSDTYPKWQEVHQTRESDNPVVHGINNVATIELEDGLVSETRANKENKERTKRPLASPWFRRNTALGVIPIGLE